MKLIERTCDVVTGDVKMEDLHTMLEFPVFMGCVDHPEDEDICSELTWQINRNSGLLQLKKLIPLDILYQSQHSGAVGKIWMDHHQRFAKFLSNTHPTSVLELGGAHGILSIKYRQFKNIPWTILEPNPLPIEGCKARFIKGFFDESFTYTNEFDTIVHSHVFEHIYRPDEFMKQLSSFMSIGQKLVFSIPNMQVMLERKYTNCINFEHTVFLTEPYVEYLMAKYGFSVASKEYFMEDHSIFYSAVRSIEVNPVPLQENLYERNMKLYIDYVDYHKTLIKELNQKTSETTQPIYLFGAHVFAQYLLAMGLNAAKIVCLLDNDTKKQGKRLYGTKLNVSSPRVLLEVDRPIVILKAGVYNEEIKSDILENINRSTIFLE
jgi:hypothetical protein